MIKLTVLNFIEIGKNFPNPILFRRTQTKTNQFIVLNSKTKPTCIYSYYSVILQKSIVTNTIDFRCNSIRF
ncbi:hypothetical protein LEP1GSC064_3884 [Leptospira kirschneri serovar Grippotyphosa str. Moskva]|nr:hypothetical protein LEP1GSC044_1441 [Leptospira kirschneri serovar Grippotyphosa str. RM52]EKQ82229.1 hypothetical protein LEP1GSC064_3884 [Leptospira kirschneri serovar Grippotyphosa str. Moskva]EKR10177.1 hypothetical protein LEP1GSC122_4059 [Leptospira kirschneri serovar Valbuzzi str. 200702274]EMK02781.1 hypothetical protein LEP1GSC176_0834 [Leptospira kirschneri str. MMD1493]EMO81979.1 hypothetical protein LEP1GSC126_2070 [Leptospira kirschneri str. 200801774]OOV49269.1 hypothetical p